MKAKETIAILGLRKGEATQFLEELANEHRLLIVLRNINDSSEASDYLIQNQSKHEVELIDCAKDGCWEADHIILCNPLQFKEEELSRLRAVSTQKIILLVIDQEYSDSELPLFPNSKIVKLVLDPLTMEAKISGKDKEAVDSIYELMRKTEYITL